MLKQTQRREAQEVFKLHQLQLSTGWSMSVHSCWLLTACYSTSDEPINLLLIARLRITIDFFLFIHHLERFCCGQNTILLKFSLNCWFCQPYNIPFGTLRDQKTYFILTFLCPFKKNWSTVSTTVQVNLDEKYFIKTLWDLATFTVFIFSPIRHKIMFKWIIGYFEFSAHFESKKYF